MEFRDMELTILFYANENRILTTRLDASYRYNHELEDRNKKLQDLIYGVDSEAIEIYKRTISELKEKIEDLRAELASVQGSDTVVSVE